MTDRHYGDFVIVSGDLKISREHTEPEFNTKNPTGNLIADGMIVAQSVVSTSDRRLKSEIKKVDNIRDILFKLDSYCYRLNGDGTKRFGFIAQDVKDIFPECSPKINGTDICHLDYNGIISLLFSATKDINTDVDRLKRIQNRLCVLWMFLGLLVGWVCCYGKYFLLDFVCSSV